MDPAFRCHGMKVITLLCTNGPSIDSFLLVFAGYEPRGSGVLTYWDSAGVFPTKAPPPSPSSFFGHFVLLKTPLFHENYVLKVSTFTEIQVLRRFPTLKDPSVFQTNKFLKLPLLQKSRYFISFFAQKCKFQD